MKSLLWSVSTAVIASVLAISINLATDLRGAWWAWLAVVLLTAVTAWVTYRLTAGTDIPEKAVPTVQTTAQSAEGSPQVSNSITGDVTGKAVQAGRVDGDINL